jgi:hypothetical protein
VASTGRRYLQKGVPQARLFALSYVLYDVKCVMIVAFLMIFFYF